MLCFGRACVCVCGFVVLAGFGSLNNTSEGHTCCESRAQQPGNNSPAADVAGSGCVGGVNTVRVHVGLACVVTVEPVVAGACLICTGEVHVLFERNRSIQILRAKLQGGGWVRGC